MKKLYIDFETRSALDLKKVGADVYCSDFSSDILCLGFAFDSGTIKILTDLKCLPSDIIEHIESGRKVVAHNIHFELLVWNQIGVKKYGWPTLFYTQCDCTMARAYIQGLPPTLEKLAQALYVEHQKDMSGSRTMMQLSKPLKIKGDEIFWCDDVDKKQNLYAYCKQDVEVLREIDSKLPSIPNAEQQIWNLDYVINRRGIQIDIEAVENAMKIVDRATQIFNSEMSTATNGEITNCNITVRLTKWLKNRGVETDGITKSELDKLLNSDLPPKIKEVLEIRKKSAKNSNAKLKSMFESSGDDGRVRGLFQYHGARTGRWSGRRIQPHNLPRSFMTPTKIEKFLDNLSNDASIEYYYMHADKYFNTISESLRGLITAKPNHELICADYSSIEARVLAWLTGEQKILEAFKTHGKIYELQASLIFNVPLNKVTSEQRQIGKVSILALGYGGGVKAFQGMASKYGLNLPEDRIENIKQVWRANNPHIVKFWNDLEIASIHAVKNKNQNVEIYSPYTRIRFKSNKNTLACELPSGRKMYYAYPKIEVIETPWGESRECLTYMSNDTFTKKWERTKSYGGLLCENITQAVARDILANAMLNLERKGYSIVMHVHDEIVCEVLKDKKTLNEFEFIMSKIPLWAVGLPLKVSGWKGMRYRK